ncbi:hypothetical protein LXL04_000132 [Taraxacum kok-saghyz]
MSSSQRRSTKPTKSTKASKKKSAPPSISIPPTNCYVPQPVDTWGIDNWMYQSSSPLESLSQFNPSSQFLRNTSRRLEQENSDDEEEEEVEEVQAAPTNKGKTPRLTWQDDEVRALGDAWVDCSQQAETTYKEAQQIKESAWKIKEKMQLRKIIQQDRVRVRTRVGNEEGCGKTIGISHQRVACTWLAHANHFHQIWSACANSLKIIKLVTDPFYPINLVMNTLNTVHGPWFSSWSKTKMKPIKFGFIMTWLLKFNERTVGVYTYVLRNKWSNNIDSRTTVKTISLKSKNMQPCLMHGELNNIVVQSFDSRLASISDDLRKFGLDLNELKYESNISDETGRNRWVWGLGSNLEFSTKSLRRPLTLNIFTPMRCRHCGVT